MTSPYLARGAEGLGSALKYYRRDKGWTQQELADWLAVDRTTVGRMESGSNSVVKSVVEAFALLDADIVIIPRGTFGEMISDIPIAEPRKPTWDVFYLVLHSDAQSLKFGITSGDPNRRLAAHRADGYTYTLRLLVNFPQALELETYLREVLEHEDFEPLHGREYFPMEALPYVMEAIEDFLKLTGTVSDGIVSEQT